MKQSLCLFPSGLVVLQLTFCFFAHHITALRCYYWQHVIKSGKSNFRVVRKYMDRRYCNARHVGLFKLDSAVRKGRKLLDIYRLNDTPDVFPN